VFFPNKEGQQRASNVISEHSGDYFADLSLLAYHILITVANDSVGPAYPASIAAVLEFMKQNLQRKITVAQLARTARLSSAQFYRVFERHVGEAPLQFFTRMKIRRAAALLRHTSVPVKQVAFMLGYEEPAYFSKQFRQEMGVSPKAYRRQSSK
jgi:transcriptional regulator GlxA family with amidase domain